MKKEKKFRGSIMHPNYMGTGNLVANGTSIFHKNIPLMRKYWKDKK